MSRSLELALKFGGVLVTIDDNSAFAPVARGRSYQAVVIPLDQVEANYHAARAEALREAANVCDHEHGTAGDAGMQLRAMADREAPTSANPAPHSS